MPVLTHLNEESYHHLHQTSLYQPTRREKKLTNMMQNPVEAPLVLQPKNMEQRFTVSKLSI